MRGKYLRFKRCIAFLHVKFQQEIRALALANVAMFRFPKIAPADTPESTEYKQKIIEFFADTVSSVDFDLDYSVPLFDSSPLTEEVMRLSPRSYHFCRLLQRIQLLRMQIKRRN